MITKSRLLLIFLLLLAGVLARFKVPLASSQGVTIVAAQVEGLLPLDDVTAAVWQEATAVSIPLSAQIIARPLFPQAHVKAVDVRALYNDTQIAFLVEWEDDSQDEDTVRIQDFADAVAVQFPLIETSPFFCMGQAGGNVNIWHWKADWQAAISTPQDMDTTYPDMYVDNYPFADMTAGATAPVESYADVNYLPALAAGNLFANPTYASPVEDLLAGGFGTLTSQPVAMQNVQGYGSYADGQWRVIFGRDLTSSQSEDAQFATDQVYSLAFAAWDGANEERNGQKSTSQWVSLQLGHPTTASGVGVTESDRGGAGSTVNTLEGLPYVLVPMGGVLGLVLLFGLGVWLMSKLPDKK